MFLFASSERRIKRIAQEIAAQSLKRVEADLNGIRTAADLSAKVKQLQEEIETLTLQKGRKEEEYAKQTREIEHKVGLERKRQEFEIEAAKRETTVTVREENLAAEQKRFAEQMKFHEERFTAEVGYLKGMLEQVLSKLGVDDGDSKRARKTR